MPDMKEAIEMAEELAELCARISDECNARDSWEEKAADIRLTIEQNGKVTDKQFTALENMLEGARRWVRD
jgi:hypothetical protein